VTPILLEHELPGHALGRRLPFETPAVDPEPHGDPVDEAFAELGLPMSADAAAVRRAYRDRVTETHPDQGGDEAAFRKLREAYTTARRHADDD
jgi:DnaJ-domain-containing protein 1